MKPNASLARISAVVGAFLALAGCGGGGSGDGPLTGVDLSLGQRVEVGTDLSLGVVLLFVDSGDEPARIERVRLVGVKGSMEMLGVRTRPLPSDKGTFTSAAGFPPAEFDSQPLADQAEVPVSQTRTAAGGPLEGLELVIGLRATEPGVTAARAVEVTYRVGDREYQKTFDQSVHLCAPITEYTNCPPPTGEDDFGDGVLG